MQNGHSKLWSREGKKILVANNLGAFFKFANKKLSSPSGISPLMDPFGNLLTTDEDKAKLLSEYFASVYTIDNGITPPFQSCLSPNTLGINDIPISSLRVKNILSKLKSNSAAGPDQLPPIFYRNTASAIDCLYLCCSVPFLTFAIFLTNGGKP